MTTVKKTTKTTTMRGYNNIMRNFAATNRRIVGSSSNNRKWWKLTILLSFIGFLLIVELVVSGFWTLLYNDNNDSSSVSYYSPMNNGGGNYYDDDDAAIVDNNHNVALKPSSSSSSSLLSYSYHTQNSTTTITTTATRSNNNNPSVSHGAATASSNNNKVPPVIHYPLDGYINISSAKESYSKGFWQRMAPVPYERWNIVSNTTCLLNNNNTDISQQQRQHGNNNNNDDWIRRVPRVIIIGAQKGGTTALSSYLYNHPNIVKLTKKELHYFDEDLDQNVNIIQNNQSSINNTSGGGIPSDIALKYYHESVIGNLIDLQHFFMDTSKSILDATPNYLFASDRVPQRICCIVPWVKLICLLRNPIDRAYSQYNMQFNRDLQNPKNRRFVGSKAPTFEEYIEMDMNVLKETGVIQQQQQQQDYWSSSSSSNGDVNFNNSSNNNFSKGSTTTTHHHEQLDDAWSTYTKLGLNSPIGRGLYSIQIRHWIQTLKTSSCKNNKSLSDGLLILRSEDMKSSPDVVYKKVLKFLNLKSHTMGNFGKVHATSYRSIQMNPTTRKMLEDFYRPYNQQLEHLLGNEWNRVWE